MILILIFIFAAHRQPLKPAERIEARIATATYTRVQCRAEFAHVLGLDDHVMPSSSDELISAIAAILSELFISGSFVFSLVDRIFERSL